MSDVAGNQPMSRRERLKQEREARILEAAAAVFARKGFHQATIREIAELADVADGTIYNYYADKRDLLVLGQHGRTRIVTVRQMLELLERS